jgi:hypothetical protein
MNNWLITETMHFPNDYFENKNITEREMEYGRFFIRNIFNLKHNYNIDDSNLNYGQLIKVAALASRSPRCCDVLEYIMEGFQNHIHPNWRSYYNLIFMGPNFGNILGQEPLEIVSQIRYNRRDYSDLNPNEQQNCYNLNILVMEIHLVIKLIVQQIKLAKIPKWSDALNSYNLFDKFEKLFHNLFEFHITHTRHNLSMSLYRKVRNCIAHSNFILQNNIIKFVEWDREQNVVGIIEENIDYITLEMRLLCTIICQIMALYQLMQQ